VDLELLARLARADCLGRTGYFDCSAMDWFIARARALGVEHRPPAPLLLGRHLLALGLSPGPRVGEILKQVYERQLDGDVTSLEDGIVEARRLL
jgi:tRNA nucleotidyltransferase (CCA-adding enzyme)